MRPYHRNRTTEACLTRHSDVDKGLWFRHKEALDVEVEGRGFLWVFRGSGRPQVKPVREVCAGAFDPVFAYYGKPAVCVTGKRRERQTEGKCLVAMSDVSAPAKQEQVPNLDIDEIMKRIPHRYPFLMIEQMQDIVLGESAVGIKNVSVNEPHFQGHFPEQPVMPGVLIVEAMAQTAAVLVMETLGHRAHRKIVYFMTIENARFRRPVRPGDRLEIHVKKQHNRGQVWKFTGEAKVGGKVAAQASYSAMIVDKE